MLVRGQGVRLWDSEGKEYLDCVGGIAVDALGPLPSQDGGGDQGAGRDAHPREQPVPHRAADSGWGNCSASRPSPDRVFFCNSGAEANEAAIKLARKYAKDRWSTDRTEIIAMQHAFHGRTLATLTATGNPKYLAGFEPVLPGFKHVPYNDLRAVERALDSHTCAVLVEPVQGRGGREHPERRLSARAAESCATRRASS